MTGIYGQCNTCGVATATIEIPPYKDPCHCKKLIGHFKHTVVTLGLLWYQLHKAPARQRAQITSLTILGTRSLKLCIVMEFFMQQVTPSQMFRG